MNREILTDFNDNCAIGATTDVYFNDEEEGEERPSSWSQKEKYEFLKRCMQLGLTEKQRKCLTMHVLERKTMQEIAEELGLNRSTVCRHIKYAKEKIRKLTYIARGNSLH